MAVRQYICDFMKAFPEVYAPFALAEADSMEAYLNMMRKKSEWGGHLELAAFSAAFGVGVCVHVPGDFPIVIDGMDVVRMMIAPTSQNEEDEESDDESDDGDESDESASGESDTESKEGESEGDASQEKAEKEPVQVNEPAWSRKMKVIVSSQSDVKGHTTLGKAFVESQLPALPKSVDELLERTVKRYAHVGYVADHYISVVDTASGKPPNMTPVVWYLRQLRAKISPPRAVIECIPESAQCGGVHDNGAAVNAVTECEFSLGDVKKHTSRGDITDVNGDPSGNDDGAHDGLSNRERKRRIREQKKEAATQRRRKRS